MDNHTLHVEIPSGYTGSVFLAHVRAEAVSSVSRGENGGRTLRHVGVVRELRQIGTAGPAGFRSEVPLGDLSGVDRLVVILQESGPGRILGAASISL
jgi:hypothetical protein